MRAAARAAASHCPLAARRGVSGRAAASARAEGAPPLAYTLAYTLAPAAPTVYAQVTAASNCATLARARGAAFARRIARRVPPLPEGCEPEASRVAAAVEELLAAAEAAAAAAAAQSKGDAAASAAAAAPRVVFAGHGDPLLRLECVEAVSRAVRRARPRVRLRANSSGLLPAGCAPRVAAAVDEVSLLLHAADEGVCGVAWPLAARPLPRG